MTVCFCLFYAGTLFIGHRAEFDPERPSVSIVIEARDGGSPPLSSLTTVQVQISDINDNAPVFHQSEYRSVYNFWILDVLTAAAVLYIYNIDLSAGLQFLRIPSQGQQY